MEVLKSVKCTVGVIGKGNLGVDVFHVCEFVVKSDSKNFTILCVWYVVVVVSDRLKTSTGSGIFIENGSCAFL